MTSPKVVASATYPSPLSTYSFSRFLTIAVRAHIHTILATSVALAATVLAGLVPCNSALDIAAPARAAVVDAVEVGLHVVETEVYPVARGTALELVRDLVAEEPHPHVVVAVTADARLTRKVDTDVVADVAEHLGLSWDPVAAVAIHDGELI